VAGALAISLFAAAGCGPNLPPSKPYEQLTESERVGYRVFQNNCARCHYANSTHGLHGPGLQGLYKQSYLPSGAPANDDRVTAAVLHGRTNMPEFADKLNEEELVELIAYLHTL